MLYINAIFKEVKKALGNDIVSRLEHLDRNKAIMIVCGDDHLTKGIVSYIWYTHPPILVYQYMKHGYDPKRVSLRHKDYSRWTEEQVKIDLRARGLSFKEVVTYPDGTKQYKRKWDYIQFFQNLKGSYLEALKYLLDMANEYKYTLLKAHEEELQRIEQNYKQNFPNTQEIKYKNFIEEAKNRILENGRMLIVGTDTLPQEFKDQFEIIKFDAEKQSKTVDISQGQPESERQSKDNVFRWCGGTWEITFDGKTIRPPDSFGLKYIHYLLKHPDKEIYATELRLITGTQLRERSNKSYDEEKKDNEESSGIESGDKMNKILDSTSIEEIKRAIGYLSEQSIGAEEEERAELLDKKTPLELYLKKAKNINADSRDFSTDLEKARKAVSKCITDSLTIIQKEHTSLEQYLSTTIKMGSVFQYKHTSKIDWQLS